MSDAYEQWAPTHCCSDNVLGNVVRKQMCWSRVAVGPIAIIWQWTSDAASIIAGYSEASLQSAMRLLLAIDDSKFAEAAIDAVFYQVRQDHTQVLVLHALDWSNFMPAPFPGIGVEPTFSERQLESIVEGQTQRAQDLVKTAAERLRSAGFGASTSIREGDLKMVILDCATEWIADLIVVGSHGRKGVTRLLLGSVSETVARHAHCSVEIVRLPTNS